MHLAMAVCAEKVTFPGFFDETVPSARHAVH